MNARKRLSVMVRTDRGSMTVWSPAEVTDALDAHRAEVLAEDGQAYDGELAMLRGLVRTLRTVIRDAGTAEKQRAEVERLLHHHAADDAAAREKSSHQAEATPDFFQPGRTYEYAGLHILFRCDAVGIHPVTGDPSAVGWIRYTGGGWSPGDYSPAEYADGWADVTEAVAS